MLRTATWFIRNDDIYRELQFTPFREVIAKCGVALFQGVEAYDNPLDGRR